MLTVLAVLATGCGRDSNASSTSVSDAALVPSSGANGMVPNGFDRTTATLGPADAEARNEVVELDVWFAGEQDEWVQGLMGVTDLDGADGMIFVFDAAAEYRFHMWNTPMPLDIFFFDADGRFVGSDPMDPCLEESQDQCERYSPDEPFQIALEVPRGSLDAHPIDDTRSISFEPPDREPTGTGS